MEICQAGFATSRPRNLVIDTIIGNAATPGHGDIELRTLALIAFLLPAPLVADPLATDEINTLRKSQGLQELVYSRKLEKAAKSHAEDMVRKGFFSHTGSDGSDVGKRVRRAGYDWCFVAENIAKGQNGLDAVMTAWAQSPGHRANMLSRGRR